MKIGSMIFMRMSASETQVAQYSGVTVFRKASNFWAAASMAP